MPQGRKKVPFSGKAKKQQLQAKRLKRTTVPGPVAGTADDESESSLQGDKYQKLNAQPSSRAARSNPNRFVLQFHRESEAVVRQRREAAHKTLKTVPETELEISVDTYFEPGLDFPKRPPWDYKMTPAELDAQEHRYFREYVDNLEKKFDWRNLSYFELNLETWRQLWRVLEMSDIVLLIVDIRFPALMFPPSLYEYVTQTLKKQMILVLNKVDLAPCPVVLAWKHYFQEKFPEMHVLLFTTYPEYNMQKSRDGSKKEGLQVRRRKRKVMMAVEGAQKLYEACKDIVKGELDLTPWKEKIAEERNVGFEMAEDGVEVGETIHLKSVDTSFVQHEKYKDGVLTIGCLGQPNVGKSSLMNSLMGKKVVSVSKTPGHTKHFQTIYLTNNVRLCDCPGLVFPSKAPKVLQILMGSFPIAQVREPFSAVQFIAERMNLPKLLNLKHPENDDEWSAMDVCEAWAMKRGFYTAKAARLDSYRAANHLLRLSLEGRIPVCLYPHGYCAEKETWEKHKDLEMVKYIQGFGCDQNEPASDVSCDDDDDEEEDYDDEEPIHTPEQRRREEREDEQDEEAEGADDSRSSSDEGPSGLVAGNKFAALDVCDD